MIDELRHNLLCCADDRGTRALIFTPELPKPGDEVRVAISLPEFVTRRQGQFVITVREFESEDVVFAEPFRKRTKEPSTEVFITLPDTIKPGYYLAVLSGPGQPEIATELLILVDSVSMKKFHLAEMALQCTVDAATASKRNNPGRVVILLEKAAEYYAGSESPQCAGLALVDAAELAEAVHGKKKSESLLWAALKFLLLAGDHEGASDVANTLVASAGSISDAVGLYVSTGRAVLDEKLVDEGDLLERQKIILDVAEKSLPPPRGEPLVERMLVTMRQSQRNQYLADIDELLHLASSQIALYAPGVLVRSGEGVALHCVTFADELEESSHAFAATALAG